MTWACHAAHTPARSNGAGAGIERAPSIFARYLASTFSSVARLNAPRTGRTVASANASPTSALCNAWNDSPGVLGTTGIKALRTSCRGRNGPTKRRRCAVDASRLKMKPGRILTTRISGLLCS